MQGFGLFPHWQLEVWVTLVCAPGIEYQTWAGPFASLSGLQIELEETPSWSLCRGSCQWPQGTDVNSHLWIISICLDDHSAMLKPNLPGPTKIT
jgi:hypothetical protein